MALVSVAMSPVRMTVDRRPVEEKSLDMLSSVEAFLPQATTLAPIASAVETADPPNLPVAGATIMVSPARISISERPPNGTRCPARKSVSSLQHWRGSYQV